MNVWRLPKLKEDENIITAAKYAVQNTDSIAGILTCVSVEAGRNELGTMACVLMELANGLSESTNKIETLIRLTERQTEKINEQDKTN